MGCREGKGNQLDRSRGQWEGGLGQRWPELEETPLTVQATAC